jgi:prenyltransferase/squalene oxidase-like repeat protein
MKKSIHVLFLALLVAGGCGKREELRQKSERLEREVPLSESKPRKAAVAANTSYSVPVVKSPGFKKGVFGTRSPGVRGDASYRYRFSTEGAVIRCLRWLKKVQNEDGSWGGKDEPKSVATGIALLPFLGRGETPASPEFGKTVQAAMKFLVSIQNEDGTFRETEQAPALQHAIITLALAESYGMTKIPKLKESCNKAWPVIIKGQNTSGLWGIQYGKEDDIESSVWQVRALKVAKMGKLDTTEIKPVLRKAAEALKKIVEANKKDRTIAPMLCCLQLIGYANDPVCKSGIEALSGLTMNWEKPEFENPVYNWHFVTQATFQYGGNTWRNWNRKFSVTLVKAQQIIPKAIKNQNSKLVDCGYWVSPGKKERYGEVYSTALCCMMLQNNYHHVPFSRPIDVREKKSNEEGLRRAENLDIDVQL